MPPTRTVGRSRGPTSHLPMRSSSTNASRSMTEQPRVSTQALRARDGRRTHACSTPSNSCGIIRCGKAPLAGDASGSVLEIGNPARFRRHASPPPSTTEVATRPHAGLALTLPRPSRPYSPVINGVFAPTSSTSLHRPPRAAKPMSATPSNACAATSPARQCRTNASRSMTAGRSCIDSSTPSVTERLMSCSTPSNSCKAHPCAAPPSGQPPAVQVGNPADLAHAAELPVSPSPTVP